MGTPRRAAEAAAAGRERVRRAARQRRRLDPLERNSATECHSAVSMESAMAGNLDDGFESILWLGGDESVSTCRAPNAPLPPPT